MYIAFCVHVNIPDMSIQMLTENTVFDAKDSTVCCKNNSIIIYTRCLPQLQRTPHCWLVLNQCREYKLEFLKKVNKNNIIRIQSHTV